MSTSSVTERLARQAGRWNLRLTTRGRTTGRPRTVTIWFVADGDRLWLGTLDPDRNWPKNLLRHEQCELEIGPEHFSGTARPLRNPAELRELRRRFARKYLPSRILGWFGVGARLGFEVTLDRDPPAPG